MLHELFLSLLGFTGDIIVSSPLTFHVNNSFDLFTSAEIQQLNRIVPLGWYYLQLSLLVKKYEIKWGIQIGDTSLQFYRTAFSQGINDLLTEYTSDIAYLEQLVVTEGSVPLSHVMYHLQKYLLILPVIYNMSKEMEQKHIKGCQLLDYIKFKRSGVPIIDQIVQRLLVKIRAVFLKQCLAWMLYGELEDPAEEFFIQLRSSNGR